MNLNRMKAGFKPQQAAAGFFQTWMNSATLQTQALEILLASLKSKTILTDVVLLKKKVRLQEVVAWLCTIIGSHVQITPATLLRMVVRSCLDRLVDSS